VTKWVLGGLALGAAFWAGRASVGQKSPASGPAQVAPQASAAAPEPAPHARRVPRRIERPYLVRPAELFTATDPAAEQHYRVQQARELMDLVRNEVARANKMNLSGIPEMAANDAFMYTHGFIQAITRTAPDLTVELADEITHSQCSTSASPAERITLSRMVTAMPELATPQALDCVFTQVPEEDMVMWSTLEAWRASGLPKSKAIAEVERKATDSRTRFWFLSDEQMKQEIVAQKDGPDEAESHP
jgi:hypothetical protein